MYVVIIQNPNLNILSSTAISYLRSHSSVSFKLFSNENPSQTVTDEYLLGCRHFILAITSGEILSISNLITNLSDVKFVSPSSTVIALRGLFPNLYFTSTSDVYVEDLALVFRAVSTCAVYESSDDPYIVELLTIFRTAGIPTFEVSDLAWQQFPDILIVTLSTPIWNQVVANLLPTQTYNLNGFELYPPNDLILPSNVISIVIFFPYPTVLPQLNSYWNIVSKEALFSACNSINSVYPLLLQDVLCKDPWVQLEQFNLISSTFQINGYFNSRYLPLYPADLKYNLQNDHLSSSKQCGYIWLVDNSIVDTYLVANLNYLRKINPWIHKIKYVDSIKTAVKTYWRRGYRHFILEAPSKTVEQVQRLSLKGGLFICPYATSPLIRKPGSAFIFALSDDDTMVQFAISAANKAALGHATIVLGSSDNVNIPEFEAELTRNTITSIPFDRFTEFDPTTALLGIVGTDSQYQAVLDYVVANKDRYPYLTVLNRYGAYITKAQSDTLIQLFGPGYFCLLAYNSCQPFLQSTYSTISRPTFLVDFSNFIYLWNILLQYSPQFLFDFGYMIDI